MEYMAIMQLMSTNEHFPDIIHKNPESKMRIKNMRKGTVMGYYSKGRTDTYNCVFIDGMDEMSFCKYENQNYEFADSARYESALFPFSVVKEFFHTTFQKKEEYDEDGYDNKVIIPSIEVKRKPLIEKVLKTMPEYNVEMVEDTTNSMKMIISTKKSLHNLMNFVYVLSTVITIINEDNLLLDNGILKRIALAINDVNAGYFTRYLVKTMVGHANSKLLNDIKKDLENWNDHTIVMDNFSNGQGRINTISKIIPTCNTVVDFGCGEGKFLPIARKIDESHYYIAIDKNAECLDKIEHKADLKGLDNVITYSSIDEFMNDRITGNEDKYVVMMNECIEHNELDEAKSIISKFLDDKYCTTIIITTPNMEFNQFYNMGEGELRHEDHKFELTEEEFKSFIQSIDSVKNTHCVVKGIGDSVDGISTTIMCTINKN